MKVSYRDMTENDLRGLYQLSRAEGREYICQDIEAELRRRKKASAWQDLSDTAASIECNGGWKDILTTFHDRTRNTPLRNGSKLYIVRRLIEAILADEAGVPAEQLPYIPRKGAQIAALNRLQDDHAFSL